MLKADNLDYELKEDEFPNPITDYGKSKLLAEQFIFSQTTVCIERFNTF